MFGIPISVQELYAPRPPGTAKIFGFFTNMLGSAHPQKKKPKPKKQAEAKPKVSVDKVRWRNPSTSTKLRKPKRATTRPPGT